MTIKEIRAYCRSKWMACEDYPFGDIPICYRLNKKIFAQIYPNPENYKITLKCTMETGQFYRQVYPGVVVRGYHCPPVQQPYWNTIDLAGLPDNELLNMIDHAYDTVLHSFSKTVQKQIMTADNLIIRCIRAEEYPFLEDFLYDAVYIPDGSALLPREIIHQPELYVYIEDFGRPDDLCLVGESQGYILGAVWTRILAGEIKGYGNIDDRTPEVCISVKQEFRRQGIGRKLMQEMITLLKSHGYEKISLSVSKGNCADQMYRKLGFEVLIEGEEDYLMVLKLQEQ